MSVCTSSVSLSWEGSVNSYLISLEFFVPIYRVEFPDRCPYLGVTWWAWYVEVRNACLKWKDHCVTCSLLTSSLRCIGVHDHGLKDYWNMTCCPCCAWLLLKPLISIRLCKIILVFEAPYNLTGPVYQELYKAHWRGVYFDPGYLCYELNPRNCSSIRLFNQQVTKKTHSQIEYMILSKIMLLSEDQFIIRIHYIKIMKINKKMENNEWK